MQTTDLPTTVGSGTDQLRRSTTPGPSSAARMPPTSTWRQQEFAADDGLNNDDFMTSRVHELTSTTCRCDGRSAYDVENLQRYARRGLGGVPAAGRTRPGRPIVRWRPARLYRDSRAHMTKRIFLYRDRVVHYETLDEQTEARLRASVRFACAPCAHAPSFIFVSPIHGLRSSSTQTGI